VQVGHLADEIVIAEHARLDALGAECVGHEAGVPGEVRGHAPRHPPASQAYSAGHVASWKLDEASGWESRPGSRRRAR
jgi:hypothetical protein